METGAPETSGAGSASSSGTSDPSSGAGTSGGTTRGGSDGSDSLDDGTDELDVGTPEPRRCSGGERALHLCFNAQTLVEGHSGIVSTTGDVDGDGFLDIVYVSSIADGSEDGFSRLVVVPGTGGRLFADPVVTAWDVADLACLRLVDVDGDGALDLVGNDPYMPGLWLAPGDGAAVFAPPYPLVLPFSAVSWTSGDLDGDGIDEIVLSPWLQSSELAIVSWLDPAVPSLTLRDTGFSPRDVVIADLGHGDASLDIVVAGHVGEQWQLRVANGDAEGTDPWSTVAVGENGMENLHVVDVDTDGLEDVLSFHVATFELRLRTGPAELAAPVAEPVPSGNGIENVLFGAFLPGTGLNIAAISSVRVLVHDHEDFPWGYDATPQLSGRSASAADLDADGRDDIAAPDYGRNSLVVLWNESTGL